MLEKNIKTLFDKQINRELFSAYLYLDIANYYIDQGLEGFGSWYNIQAKEELDHANLMIQFLQNNGESVVLAAIDMPKVKYENFKTGLLESLKHERYITKNINDIYDAAMAAKDFKTLEFLNWFIKEQVEEEKNAEDQIKKFELFDGDKRALYMLDKDLGTRVYSAPSLVLE